MEGETRATDTGNVVWLVGLNPGVLETVRHAGLHERLGRERMLFNARAAIEGTRLCRPRVSRCGPRADELSTVAVFAVTPELLHYGLRLSCVEKR